MRLIFERGREGRRLSLLPPCDVPKSSLPEEMRRKTRPSLPELSEPDIGRHYNELASNVYGVCDGFYPLGSCTMKYNPRINEEIAALPGFTDIHPLQPEETAQGCLELLYRSKELLCEISGMDEMSFQPAAGAHGEYTGLLLIRAYHLSRGDSARNKIIVPDSAHGTNPASAVMAGFQILSIPSDESGCVDLDGLRSAVGPDTAGLMLTNPNTVGLFENNITEIARIVHDAGGLCYYDGANLNAVMGIVRPGDMGFDCVHLNLHKTFSTPHGGGGPGSGPVGCKEFLATFLPVPLVTEQNGKFSFKTPGNSVGKVRSFYGNFLVVIKALSYILTLGREGITEASKTAVLNANYLLKKLSKYSEIAFGEACMHEFVLTLENLKKETGVTAMDVSKRLLDYDIHPPTMYFPLIVHEALMFEPTETEGKETLDEAAEIYRKVIEEAYSSPETLQTAPHNALIGRPDEVSAARSPILRWSKENQ